MNIVYDTEPNGKQVPYYLPENSDLPAIAGIPVAYSDIYNINWAVVITKLHNAYMAARFYSKEDIKDPMRRKHFMQLTNSIINAEILKHFST